MDIPLRLIHYGDLSKGIKPIKIEPYDRSGLAVKPSGALWTSPEHAEYGWEHFCQGESLQSMLERPRWLVEIHTETRCYKIDTYDDLALLIKQYGPVEMYLGSDSLFPDWPAVAKQYDAIWLTSNGQWETRLTRPYSLYGWDCESVAILDHRCIKDYRLYEVVQA